MQASKTEISFEQLDQLLEVIFEVYGYDFRQYSKASILRRVQRFFDDGKYKSLEDFQNSVVNKSSIFDLFLQRITVNVTEMFRDPQFYKAFKEEVIPVLATYPIIKIWHAGCSSGEEVFSIAILLHEAGLLKRSRIYATDINPNNIAKAKKGIVPLDVMKDYVSNYINAGGEADFASYYTAIYNNAIIINDLKENILFSPHNLVTDQVFNEFQVIFCRNVMIYFNRELQDRVIKLFHDSLSNFGFLALGIKESLTFAKLKDRFRVVGSGEKIYRRIA